MHTKKCKKREKLKKIKTQNTQKKTSHKGETCYISNGHLKYDLKVSNNLLFFVLLYDNNYCPYSTTFA